MIERPHLGFSALSNSKFTTTPLEKLTRIGLALLAAAFLAVVFYYLTGAVQSSTAHATSDDSNLHYDPNAPSH